VVGLGTVLVSGRRRPETPGVALLARTQEHGLVNGSLTKVIHRA
jgi:hypothetical protein